MTRTLIIYESKYGTTEETVKALAAILGPSKTCRVNQFKDEYKNFDFFVIATPIYSEKSNQNIFNFILHNKDWLKEKKVVLLCICISVEKGEKYLERIADILGDCIICKKVTGGRLYMDKLDECDSNLIKSFYIKSGVPIQDTDMFSLESISRIGLEIRSLKEGLVQKLDAPRLKEEIEVFLNEHNTCTLCTGYNNRVRATPIEYMYDDGYLYMISEGGEKFANILLNDSVSICIYSNYKNFTDIAGMQIGGRAQIIDFSAIEYKQMLKIKAIDEDKTISLPSNINMIKVEIKKVEFLLSKFKSMGFDMRQVYTKE